MYSRWVHMPKHFSKDLSLGPNRGIPTFPTRRAEWVFPAFFDTQFLQAWFYTCAQKLIKVSASARHWCGISNCATPPPKRMAKAPHFSNLGYCWDCVHFTSTENDRLSPNPQVAICDEVTPTFCPTRMQGFPIHNWKHCDCPLTGVGIPLPVCGHAL